MLSAKQIDNNKIQFENLIKSIERPDCDIPGLLDYLLKSDFYYAPATTQYFCSYDGGLCEHVLDVYKILTNLVNTYMPNKYTHDTIVIVALMHDICKRNYFEETTKNIKVYSERGIKTDNIGKFNWETIKSFKVSDTKGRETYGSKGINTYMITSKFLALTKEEMVTLINQYNDLGQQCENSELSSIINKYPLVVLLHTADTLASYIVEKSNEYYN